MYRCVTNLPGGRLPTTIIAYSAHDSSVWVEFGKGQLIFAPSAGERGGWGTEKLELEAASSRNECPNGTRQTRPAVFWSSLKRWIPSLLPQLTGQGNHSSPLRVKERAEKLAQVPQVQGAHPSFF